MRLGDAGQAGEHIISGEVVAGGVECPLFRTDEGETFALSSISKAEAPVGTRMRLRGQEDMVSICMQGRAFTATERLD